jgi:hypothetical protein
MMLHLGNKVLTARIPVLAFAAFPVHARTPACSGMHGGRSRRGM